MGRVREGGRGGGPQPAVQTEPAPGRRARLSTRRRWSALERSRRAPRPDPRPVRPSPLSLPREGRPGQVGSAGAGRAVGKCSAPQMLRPLPESVRNGNGVGEVQESGCGVGRGLGLSRPEAPAGLPPALPTSPGEGETTRLGRDRSRAPPAPSPRPAVRSLLRLPRAPRGPAVVVSS